jgi:translation elongation factor EF-Ts
LRDLLEKIKLMRELTTAGVSDCREALIRADGDIDLAIEWLPGIACERGELPEGATVSFLRR